MPRVGEFHKKTIGALEKRAGFRCSFPGCKSFTAGPSRETETSVSNTGTACHIFAASDGPSARRVLPSLSPDKLRHINNGIWMCRTHGKIIDDDECTYTPELLTHWRKLAVRKAELRHQHGVDVDLTSLKDANLDPANIAIVLDNSDQGQKEIYEAFLVSCLADSWGAELANQARELVTEICHNALIHGGASRFSLSLAPFRITLRDNGSRFGLSDLTRHPDGRGGATAARQIVEATDQILVASSMWEAQENVHVLALVRSPGDVTLVTPCSIEITGGSPHTATQKLVEFCKAHPECQRIYVVRPYGTNHSEAHLIGREVIPHLAAGQDVVIVAPGVSYALQEHIHGFSDMIKILGID